MQALEQRFEIKSSCVGPAAVGVGGRGRTGTSNGPAPTATNGEAMVEGMIGVQALEQSREMHPGRVGGRARPEARRYARPRPRAQSGQRGDYPR